MYENESVRKLFKNMLKENKILNKTKKPTARSLYALKQSATSNSLVAFI